MLDNGRKHTYSIGMTYQKALTYYRTPGNLAAALGIKPQAIYMWKGVIPELRQHQLEKITGGELVADNFESKVAS